MNKRKPLWIPPGIEINKCAQKAPPIPYDLPLPRRVWTLIGQCDPEKEPDIAMRLVHFETAFLEDYVHDWDICDGKFYYFSRVADGGVWVMLEFD